jgi:hypothetical protein
MINLEIFVGDIIKGIILALIYLEITKANDTNLYNIIIFTIFYIIMMNGSYLLKMDPNVVTNAFLTKAIFTLIDERIKKKNPESNSDNKN